MKKVRVDILLVERGLAESRSLAQRLVMAGQVRADGQVVAKPSVSYPQDVKLEVDLGPKYVSRGGEKLEGALEAFQLDVSGMVCADIGASTGGFSDCLLQKGARKVYAIDVGQGILHWNLRKDQRVVVMEGTNARHVEKLPEAIDLVTVDASFISLKILLPVFKHWYGEQGGQAVVLVKPQFEAGRKEAARGKGVIRDPEVHRRVLEEILSFAAAEGFGVLGLALSPVAGPKGNIEFLAWLEFPGEEPRLMGERIENLLRG
jgi:23S rRNA (cytidine1920-2'-O)/16S rRNA (cytidine1409-2'-O)-methyltransferase